MHEKASVVTQHDRLTFTAEQKFFMKIKLYISYPSSVYLFLHSLIVLRLILHTNKFCLTVF